MQASKLKAHLNNLPDGFTFQQAHEEFNKARGLTKISEGTIKNHLTKMEKCKMITTKNAHKKSKPTTYHKTKKYKNEKFKI